MGYPKPLLRVDGSSFLALSAEAMLQVTARLIIVLGAHAEPVRGVVPRDHRIAITYNPDYRRGQLSSLKAGLKDILPETRAVIVHLADHPLVNPATFRAIVEEYERVPNAIIIARHQGRRGHPVLFDRALFSELMEAPRPTVKGLVTRMLFPATMLFWVNSSIGFRGRSPVVAL